jgi:hypothetical protein
MSQAGQDPVQGLSARLAYYVAYHQYAQGALFLFLESLLLQLAKKGLSSRVIPAPESSSSA